MTTVEYKEDILIQGLKDRGTALHGDEVIVMVFPKSLWDKKKETGSDSDEKEEISSEDEAVKIEEAFDVAERAFVGGQEDKVPLDDVDDEEIEFEEIDPFDGSSSEEDDESPSDLEEKLDQLEKEVQEIEQIKEKENEKEEIKEEESKMEENKEEKIEEEVKKEEAIEDPLLRPTGRIVAISNPLHETNFVGFLFPFGGDLKTAKSAQFKPIRNSAPLMVVQINSIRPKSEGEGEGDGGAIPEGEPEWTLPVRSVSELSQNIFLVEMKDWDPTRRFFFSTPLIFFLFLII